MNRSIVILIGAFLFGSVAQAEEGVVDKTKAAVEHGAEVTAHAVKKGVTAAGNGIKRGAEATRHGVEVGFHAAERGVKRGTEATGRAMHKVAEKLSPSGDHDKPSSGEHSATN
jgi:hypothetical protein